MEWADLLATPYQLHGSGPNGMDCSTVAEEIQRRLGVEPPPTSPYRIPDSKGESGEMQSYFAAMAGHYQRIGDSLGDATLLGDLVVVTDPASGFARGLFTLVDQAKGTFLTAIEGPGVVAMRRHNLRRFAVVGVYRAKLQEPSSLGEPC